MMLDPAAAEVFIGSYKLLLLEIVGTEDKDAHVLDLLALGRKRLVQNPSLLDPALSKLRSGSERLDDEVLEAVTHLQLKQWVYLRETRAHSIFLEPSGQAAYGVVGLTNRITEIVGGSGAMIETGLLPYKGSIVCDGLVSSVVWLGPSYRRSFNEALASIRAAGAFYASTLAQQDA
jgi:hypothetical protein